MQSPLYQEWIEEERKEAAQKANINRLRIVITELLMEKFDYVTKSIKEKLHQIKDEEVLDHLFRKAIKTESLESFEKILDKAQQKE